jgi:hypothetical protein
MLSATVPHRRLRLLGFTTAFFVGLARRQTLGPTGIAALAMSHQAVPGGEAATAYPGALIFLHGLGDTPAGWRSLERTLPRHLPRLSQIKYVFPAAPRIPIGINGDMEMTVRAARHQAGPVSLVSSPFDVTEKSGVT